LKIKSTFYLSVKEDNKLEKLAKKERLTKSRTIVEAVEFALEHPEPFSEFVQARLKVEAEESAQMKAAKREARLKAGELEVSVE
jgi:predicted DNA-binding protein